MDPLRFFSVQPICTRIISIQWKTRKKQKVFIDMVRAPYLTLHSSWPMAHGSRHTCYLHHQSSLLPIQKHSTQHSLFTGLDTFNVNEINRWFNNFIPIWVIIVVFHSKNNIKLEFDAINYSIASTVNGLSTDETANNGIK